MRCSGCNLTQTEQLASTKQTVHKFMEEKTADMDKLCEKLDSLQDMLQTAAAAQGAAISTHTEETSARLTELEQKATAGRGAVSEALTKFAAEAEATVAQWRAELESQRAAVTDWSVNTTAALQMLLASNDEWSEDHTAELRGLQTALERNTAAEVQPLPGDFHELTDEAVLSALCARCGALECGRDTMRGLCEELGVMQEKAKKKQWRAP